MKTLLRLSRRRHLVSLAALSLASTFAVACGSTEDSSRPAQPTISKGDMTASVSARVDDETGATLALPSGAKLTIPPKALPHDVDITFTEIDDENPDSSRRYYRIEPNLQLDLPATLTLPYEDLEEPVEGSEEPLLMVIESSTLNPTIDSSGELSNWRYADVIDRDPVENRLTVSTTHFTGFAIFTWVDEPAYMVVDVPAPFLSPGDILFTLSGSHPGPFSDGTFNWFPGHVGMFCGSDRFGLDERVKDEKQLPVTDASGIPDSVESRSYGVQNASVGSFRTGFHADHLYLGARRPKAVRFTPQLGDAVCNFGLAQRGKPYNLIGDGARFMADAMNGGYSCVGLVDAAYVSANASFISKWDRRILAVTPLDMFKETEPVKAVTVFAGEKTTIPVYGVIVDAASNIGYSSAIAGSPSTFAGYYTRAQRSVYADTVSSYTIAPGSALPKGASLVPQADGRGYELRLEPQAAGTFQVDLVMQPDVQGTRDWKLWKTAVPLPNGKRPIRQSLTVNVRERESVIAAKHGLATAMDRNTNP